MSLSRILASVLSISLVANVGSAANIVWNVGDGTWTDGVANDANWNPADEPDSNDVAIFNDNDLVELGSDNVVVGLTMSASAVLDMKTFSLEINGPTSVSGAGTRLFLDGGSITYQTAAANAATIDTSAGGTLSGNGEVSNTDVFAVVTTVFDNNGTLNASNPTTLIITPPTAATLHLSATDADSRIDLDGSLDGGDVIVSRNQTLDIDVPLTDIFNGSVQLAHNTKLDISSAWILGTLGSINVDNGATGGIGGISAGTAIIAGTSLAQNSGTITVVDTDGTLQFDAPFSMNGGTLTNNGHVIFNQTATIAAAANLDMVGSADLTVEANRTVTINQTNFNFDGSNTANTVITVNSQGQLNLSVTDYDSDSATNAFDGTLDLINGDISVTTGDAEFVMDGVLNMNSSVPGEIVAWTGEPIDIGNDLGTLDADLNVNGTRQSQIASEVDFNSDADVTVAGGATLALLGTVNFNTVNGGNNGAIAGAGTIAFSGIVNVNEAVTLNMVGGTVDLDGLDNAGDLVNIDAPLTINATSFSDFGRMNGVGVNTLDVNNSVGSGVLTVNLDSASSEWTLTADGLMNLVNDNTAATLLAGSDVNINGDVNVVGDVRSTARIDFGLTTDVLIFTAGEPFRLGGGNTGPDVNTISGGTIGGAGLLGADTGKALRGFGSISADIDFDGTANLHASGGTLTITGDIVDVNVLGTADNTGTLNIVNAWETDGGAGGSIGAVVLAGGVLQGGVITNDNPTGLQGNETITSRVINTSKIVATGGTLIVQTSGNDNDWDGAGNTGELHAIGGDLEMVDTTMPVPPVRQFGGKVRAINNHRVFANGFGLDFNPGSSIELENTATYRASSSTDIGGTVTIGVGADATIQVANNFFLTFQSGSATTLNGDLTLKNNNIIIKQGATFSGPGTLKIPDGSHSVGENLANIGTIFQMDGAFRPGNFNGIGRVQLFDFQESSTSELYVELIGTGLGQFDRLVASGDVIVDGYLNIDIDEVSMGVLFVPALGNTFNIITGNTVTGTFDTVDVANMPANLAMRVNYLPNAVQLQVVNKPFFEADFDEDGDVDSTDYNIWKAAYNLNQLGDATGDNDSDAADWVVWRNQLGSSPGAGSGSLADGAAVPEPSAVLLLFGAAFLPRRRAG